jgi:hypothetical protein
MCTIFHVRHIFSSAINMGTVQQYAIGDGEVFSILDFNSNVTSVHCWSFSVPYAENTSKDLDCHIGAH